ncbi:transposase [Rhodovulum sulfidophilum]|nr:transposase [Rhodovulum sulfidophilum]MCF4118606.1 transposase [Rhodovulum sulfidophilum]
MKRRGSLTIWFDPEMTWEAKPTDKRGRQPTCSDAAVQTCLTRAFLPPFQGATGVAGTVFRISFMSGTCSRSARSRESRATDSLSGVGAVSVDAGCVVRRCSNTALPPPVSGRTLRPGGA